MNGYMVGSTTPLVRKIRTSVVRNRQRLKQPLRPLQALSSAGNRTRGRHAALYFESAPTVGTWAFLGSRTARGDAPVRGTAQLSSAAISPKAATPRAYPFADLLSGPAYVGKGMQGEESIRASISPTGVTAIPQEPSAACISAD